MIAEFAHLEYDISVEVDGREENISLLKPGVQLAAISSQNNNIPTRKVNAISTTTSTTAVEIAEIDASPVSPVDPRRKSWALRLW